MRTNIDIDDTLLSEAMSATGMPTKKAAVEAALRGLVAKHSRIQAFNDLAGVGWEGDLDEMRGGPNIIVTV